MAPTGDALRASDEDTRDDEALIEEMLAPRLICEPAGGSWWQLLFLAVGLYLTACLGVKVWNLYATVHAFEAASGVAVDKDLPNLLATAPDLQRALALSTGAGGSPFALPHSHDVAFGALGLAMVLLSAGSLTRAQRPVMTRQSAARRRSRAFGELRIGQVMIAIGEFAEIVLLGAVFLLVVAFVYQVVLNLIGGASLSWDLVDRMIDDDVFRVLAWWR